MRIKLMLLVFLIEYVGFAQQDTITWLKYIKGGDNYTIALCQPQLESLDGNKLNGIMALSVKFEKDKIPKIIFPDIEDKRI